MTFPASPLFEEIRDDVLTELSINRTGNVRKHIMDSVNRFIRSEHRQIYTRLQWARRNIVIDVELTAGQNNYEFPDKAYPGNIEYVWAVNTDDRVQQLDRLANPRNLDPFNQSENGPPLHWWIENEQLYIGPAPSDVWPTLKIQTKAREEQFSKPGDRCQVDSELLIMRAAVRGLRFFEQHGEADRLEAKAAIYEQDVAARENSDQKIVLGQHRHRYPSQDVDRLGLFHDRCRRF